MPAQKKSVRICSTADLKDGKLCVSADTQALAIYKVNGKFFAVSNACTHAGGPLCQGSLDGNAVTCPWHGSKFDVETGKVINGPAAVAVKTYPLEVRGEDVFVEL